ncbi:BrnA antitoxin family protein [Actinobacillus porcinus]|uniref:BrnA antitoxin family protein n=1 Tax=Actinobacillus porcinus TaxID=51048 RepID=UPI0023544E21|nr:BrnA antitoxin family protein [Actinobacillus porcinus]MCI5763645.1 BrnA antitoxin family protein [Actinobacillus porcinus]MDY5422311.1 BrnA antitoxin family protein [Actinobacillus porcinus]
MKIKTLEEQLADPYYDDADQFIDDESPEWTDEDFKRALKFEEMSPELQQLVLWSRERKRGRPPMEEKKVSVTIRYSSKVIDAFKATGKGWQSRMNQVLEDYVAKSM